MEKKTMGSFLAALRRANGMTQKELAERLNVSDKSVSRWERDDGAPDLALIPVIAEVFGVTCDELLRGERAAAGEEQGAQSTPKGEQQKKHLLAASLSRFRSRCCIALALAAAGFLVAMACNSALDRALLGFFLGALLWRGAMKKEPCYYAELAIGILVWRIAASVPGLSFAVGLVSVPLGLGVVTLLLGKGAAKPSPKAETACEESAASDPAALPEDSDSAEQ